MNRSPVETVLSTAGLAALALLLLRWLRLRGRGPIAVTDGSGLQILASKKYLCSGTGSGDALGVCATGWWEHVRDDLPYCDDLKSLCEAGGGTFKYVE